MQMLEATVKKNAQRKFVKLLFCFFAYRIDDYQLRTAFQNIFALKTMKNVGENVSIFLKI